MTDETTVDELAHLGTDVEEAFGVEFGRFKNLNIYCPWCEDPTKSKSQSCSVSSRGVFVCKSCGARGTAAKFREQRVARGWTNPNLASFHSANVLWKGNNGQGKAPPISDRLIHRLHKILLTSSIEKEYLASRRGLTEETIRDFQLGVDVRRISIPVHGVDGSLVQLRLYLPNATNSPKMVSAPGGDGGPQLYPLSRMAEMRERTERLGYVILCEGEFDCMLLWQYGFAALTVTSGVETWRDEFTTFVANLGVPVVIIYDVNDKKNHAGEDNVGQRTAEARALLLSAYDIPVKVVPLPLPTKYVGGDVTNWFVDEQRTPEELAELIATAPPFTGIEAPAGEETPEATVDKAVEGPVITLHEAASARHYYEPIRLRCMVAGKAGSPYIIPAHIVVEVYTGDGPVEKLERVFQPNEGIVLSLINISTVGQKNLIRNLMGIPKDAKVVIEVKRTMNLEEVYLIPALDGEDDPGPYTLRTAYYVGHGLETNAIYEFDGYTLPNPTTQIATHVLTHAKRAAGSLDNLHLEAEEVALLRSTFATNDVQKKLEEIADDFSAHVTRIYGRNDLHTAVDLVFHSPLSFRFEGNYVRKGWLEALILGDTRTGKGFVSEGLSRYYRMGETISGENLTKAGLIAAVQRVGDRWTLVWGKLPLNDRRLVILDECSAISVQDIGSLSRIRSEGIAEVTKAVSEKTSSRTRLLWTANPRTTTAGTTKVVGDYPYGIEAVNELIGAAEDVARFDYVLVVSRGEVPGKEINKKRRRVKAETSKYPAALCHRLIEWAWSRTVDDIDITEGAEEFILRASQTLGKRFSPRVCLVQAEDVRFKLARVACAAAARTFSSPDGVKLLVTEEHARFAYNFLYHIYSKPASGYVQLSDAERERSTLRSAPAVYEALQTAGDLLEDLVDGLIEHGQITAQDLCDYAGLDLYSAKTIISALVRQRAIIKEYAYYRKKPAFQTFLLQLKAKLTNDPHITVWDDDGEDEPQETK